MSETKTYEPLAGDTIQETIRSMIILARITGDSVTTNFNEVELRVTQDSDPETVAAEYFAESKRRHEEYIASPQYRRQQRAWRIKARKERRQRRRAMERAAESATWSDRAGWDETVAANSDGYGAAVIHYAERWARLMEGEMSRGRKLSAIAKKTSQLADHEGITGFMYGCAVGILAQVWKHGEELRRWSNLDTQIGTEGERANESGGVLNPALLSVG